MDGQEEARRRAGRNIRRAMEEHDPPYYDVAPLARAAGITDASTVQDLIDGRRKSRRKTCVKVDDALGLKRGTIWAWITGDDGFFAEDQPEPTLREQREAAGLSTNDLADLIGAERSIVAGWERGKPIPPAALERLRAVLLAETPTAELVAELGRRASRGLG